MDEKNPGNDFCLVFRTIFHFELFNFFSNWIPITVVDQYFHFGIHQKLYWFFIFVSSERINRQRPTHVSVTIYKTWGKYFFDFYSLTSVLQKIRNEIFGSEYICYRLKNKSFLKSFFHIFYRIEILAPFQNF